jgi:hypothetical protein
MSGIDLIGSQIGWLDIPIIPVALGYMSWEVVLASWLNQYVSLRLPAIIGLLKRVTQLVVF